MVFWCSFEFWLVGLEVWAYNSFSGFGFLVLWCKFLGFSGRVVGWLSLALFLCFLSAFVSFMSFVSWLLLLLPIGVFFFFFFYFFVFVLFFVCCLLFVFINLFLIKLKFIPLLNIYLYHFLIISYLFFIIVVMICIICSVYKYPKFCMFKQISWKDI